MGRRAAGAALGDLCVQVEEKAIVVALGGEKEKKRRYPLENPTPARVVKEKAPLPLVACFPCHGLCKDSVQKALVRTVVWKKSRPDIRMRKIGSFNRGVVFLEERMRKIGSFNRGVVFLEEKRKEVGLIGSFNRGVVCAAS